MSLGYSLLFATFAYLLPGYQTFKVGRWVNRR
jgi:hypothetical protein